MTGADAVRFTSESSSAALDAIVAVVQTYHLLAGATCRGAGLAAAAGGEPFAGAVAAVGLAAAGAPAPLAAAAASCFCLRLPSHSREPSRAMAWLRAVGALSSGCASWRKASSPTKQICMGSAASFSRARGGDAPPAAAPHSILACGPRPAAVLQQGCPSESVRGAPPVRSACSAHCGVPVAHLVPVWVGQYNHLHRRLARRVQRDQRGQHPVALDCHFLLQRT